jgi:hypothetical protein
MRKAAIIGLCWTIFLAPMPTYGLGGDNAVYPAGSKPAGGEICFPLPDGERILQNLEALEGCKEAVEAADGVLNAAEVRSQALESRIAEQDREIASGKKTIEDTRKAGEEAAKVAAGPWYARALSVVKWVALGIVVGFVGGMAK